eukprot:CAMPEP_0168583150 /NCGR_PEP_ID=MMETSP0420-20121227/2395_1 /TAXON_ID=498008 /ORGANISM="Pessonella sp." /LENGTH=592 /DNA_ID=CAMNT_0008617751 /DNA_START=64 /DNA_END=1838 /DNA_ORIENTATION=+
MLKSASLSETDTEIFLVGRDKDASTIIIDRLTGKVRTPEAKDTIPTNGRRIEAVFGIITLIASKYLIVCTKSDTIGSLGEHKIKQAAEFDMIRLSNGSVAAGVAASDELQYLALVNMALNEPALYFCHTHDITRSLKHRSLDEMPDAKAIATGADKQFWWNHHLLQPFLDTQAYNWCVPFVKGFFKIVANCSVDGNRKFTFALLSRRSRNRAGTRYNVRGADAQGYVANEVETEQLVVSDDGQTMSLLLLRGSIPLRWTQRANIKYKPKPQLQGDIVLMKAGFKRHFERVAAHYGGPVVAVNLIDTKGGEKALGDAFESLCGELSRDMKLRYIAFDFHKECKGMRYDKLDNLLATVMPDLKAHNYTHRAQHGNILAKQQGIIRVNCMDNLDRTNVVQGLIARHVLTAQLRVLGHLPLAKQESLRPETSAQAAATFGATFEAIRKTVWADNADAISTQYSGTGALKNDFTRTGKRTFRGLLQDGANSATRYYLNNFRDGRRQDAYDVLLGVHKPVAGSPSPFAVRKRTNACVTTFLTLGIALLLITSYRPADGASWLLRLVVVATYAVLVWLSYRAALRFAPELIDSPLLVAA